MATVKLKCDGCGKVRITTTVTVAGNDGPEQEEYCDSCYDEREEGGQ